jgi:uncharacterized membrane protein
VRVTSRFDRLDALRGVAIVWMAVFHFCFDLNHFGLIREDFRGDPFWTLQRTAIVTLFLFCAGVSQAVAQAQGQTWPRFWRRWAQVAACALLVSAGSALMFPKSWISFGVLHGVAVMLVMVRILAPWVERGVPGLLALLAVAAGSMALPRFASDPFFDSRWTNWVGLITRRPVTEDYVPVLPWLGTMVLGLVVGAVVLQQLPGLLKGAVPRAAQPLAVLGRWSLSFYMVHQPVLIGALMAFLWLSGRGG